MDNILKPGLIQVAGIKSLEEGVLLQECGVDVAGIPLRLPVNETDISESTAKEIIRQLAIPACLITYIDSASECIDLGDFLEVSLIQLHGWIEPGELAQIKQNRPNWILLKSLVTGRYSANNLFRQIETFSPHVDAFITDSYDPISGAEGATGKSHDESLGRDLITASSRPVILAGGLTPENIHAKIASLHPFGVDSHTGVEDAYGNKCPQKVASFVKNARKAFAEK